MDKAPPGTTPQKYPQGCDTPSLCRWPECQCDERHIADETARVAYRATLECLWQLDDQPFEGEVRREFAVQHVGSKIKLTIEVTR